MATIKRIHDLTAFCGEGGGRYSLDHVEYNAESKRLTATDGTIAVSVAVEGNSAPTILIPAKQLKQAVKVAGKAGSVELLSDKKGAVTLDGAKLSESCGNFPDISAVMPKTPPDTLMCLSAKNLGRVVDYANQTGAEHVYFAMRHTDKQEHGIELVGLNTDDVTKDREHAVHFFFQPEGLPLVHGIIMPVTTDDHEWATRKLAEAMSFGKSPAKQKSKSKSQRDPEHDEPETKPAPAKAAKVAPAKPAAPKAVPPKAAGKKKPSAAERSEAMFNEAIAKAEQRVSNAVAEATVDALDRAKRYIDVAADFVEGDESRQAAIDKLLARLKKVRV